MGADTKANAQELVREAGGLLERLQRGVALEALSESEYSLGIEAVGRDTVSTGVLGMSRGADTNASACGAACAPERRERRGRGQQLTQHDRSRHADALHVQVELRDAVLAQGYKRNPAEVGHDGVLEHHRGQILRSVARDVVVANTVTPGHRAMI